MQRQGGEAAVGCCETYSIFPARGSKREQDQGATDRLRISTGDEMTPVILRLLYLIDLRLLTCNRDATEDKVTVEGAHAI